MLYLIQQAACPLAVLGDAVLDARCGAFDDDLEVSRGWTVNPDGTDTAPASGRWTRGNPAATASGGVALQRDVTASGRMALVTGAPAGASAGAYDLDGVSTVRSAPIFMLPGSGQELRFRWLFAHTATASAEDHLRAIVEGPGGTQTVVWQRTGGAGAVAGAWGSAAISLDAWAGQEVRIRFEAADAGTDSTVEAGIDDVRVTRPGA